MVKIEDIVAGLVQGAVKGLSSVVSVTIRGSDFVVIHRICPDIDKSEKDILVRVYESGLRDAWVVDLFKGRSAAPEEDAVASYKLDLNDPETSDRIRKHVEKYA